jgi:serine/threonine-protein kinase HipA
LSGVWLPGETRPVVTGKLTADGGQLMFNYGKSYLARDNAIALYDPRVAVAVRAYSLVAGSKHAGLHPRRLA